MKHLRALAAILALVSATLPALAGERTPTPTISIENPGKCIAPADEMRRNHMEMLKHQRDRTLRAGIRGEPASLNACIDCHASKKTGSVLGEGGQVRRLTVDAVSGAVSGN